MDARSRGRGVWRGRAGYIDGNDDAAASHDGPRTGLHAADDGTGDSAAREREAL